MLCQHSNVQQWISLKPIHPCSFGIHIFHQMNQCILCWKIVITPPIMWHHIYQHLAIFLGILNMDIAYDQIAWAIALRSTSFPPKERILSFHPSILWQSRSTKYWKQSLFSNPTWVGKSRYLSFKVSVIVFKVVQIRTLVFIAVLGLKNMYYFISLTSWSDTAQYFCSISFKKVAFSSDNPSTLKSN